MDVVTSPQTVKLSTRSSKSTPAAYVPGAYDRLLSPDRPPARPEPAELRSFTIERITAGSGIVICERGAGGAGGAVEGATQVLPRRLLRIDEFPFYAEFGLPDGSSILVELMHIPARLAADDLEDEDDNEADDADEAGDDAGSLIVHVSPPLPLEQPALSTQHSAPVATSRLAPVNMLSGLGLGI